MKKTCLSFLAGCMAISSTAVTNTGSNWIMEKHKGYTLHYTLPDMSTRREYARLADAGIKATRSFFNSRFTKEFDIIIHPDRHSLDSTWQNDWNMPGFKSECWMVASGVAGKLDMISPRQWDKQACEHSYKETQNTQKLVTHELIHVYHAQLNPSPDFSKTEGIDWFVEGLATYASGQCDAARLDEVKKMIADNKIPAGLDQFWTGKARYGLSGSVVLYIDKKYGRAKLKELLSYAKKTEILSAIGATETQLLDQWKNFMQQHIK